MKRFTLNLAAIVALVCAAAAAEPKRLLVVGATASFRHPSIENGERMIRQLAEKSGGPNEVSEAYQKHVMGGIRWALGLVDADSKPRWKPTDYTDYTDQNRSLKDVLIRAHPASVVRN